VEQSNEETARWYRQAANQGDADVQLKTGVFYEKGRGLEQSDEGAVRWYRLAAEQGHEKAQFKLAFLRVATTLLDFEPDGNAIEAAFAAAEAKASEKAT